MTLLTISTRIYPDVGGPAKQVYLMSKFLSQNGVECINIVCLPDECIESRTVKINENWTIYYLPFLAPKPGSDFLSHFIFFIKFFAYGILTTIKLKNTFNIDLIIANSPPPTGIIAYFCKKIYNIPYFYFLRGFDIPSSLYLNFLLNNIGREAEKFITVSNHAKDIIESKYGLKNVIYLPNGIDISKYYHVSSKSEKVNVIKEIGLEKFLQADDFIISYIAYMNLRQKVQGIFDFLEGFNLFLNSCENYLNEREKLNFKLLIIGNGKFFKLMKEKIEIDNLTENIRLLGRRNDV
ncbi:MAG: hypothetical protein EU548_04295, partial [Promethearchaeota archaeon]